MKIPDEVFETRCRWCIHGRLENENRDVPDSQLFSSHYHDSLPCNVLGISQATKVPGECLSFHPNWIFGICGTCMWSNQFHDGFCTLLSGPKNKRAVYLGRTFGHDGGYWDHYRSSCDKYKVRESVKDLIMRDVLRGRSPANFDPVTWEPIGKSSRNYIAEEWQEIRAKAQADREAAAQKQAAERQDPDGGQFKLF